ncbi:methyl-accepting chemotaxis protein [Acaryochloris sp. IP29b_bin.148]|uniref:methyl-accepting chemotaxis protein n=1 Tax=Acaryochloris sp. IP29b_bin.148 TaxID=2969218 RepID=UPI00260D1E8F|nr:methyl-accepting chemotaxis protein [Acaryochloris sp. IP29b_bin.148]
MTTQKDFTPTDATPNSNGNLTNVKNPLSGSSTETLSEHQAETTLKPAATLRQRLLTTVLPVALAPLALTSAIGFVQTEAQVKEKTLLRLEEVSLLTSEASTIFLLDALKFPDLINSNSLLLQAVKEGAQQSEAQGLLQKPIEAVEKQFASTKLLKPNAQLNQYLERVVRNAQLAEVFVTDKYGFNVAYSNPTSDFVQNDERWWTEAKAKGQFIEEPEFDESANTNVIAISKQIKDDSGKFLGVMKLALATKELDEAINTLVSPSLTETEMVQIVNPNLDSNAVVNTVTQQGNTTKAQEVMGGVDVVAAAKVLQDYLESEDKNVNATQMQIQNIPGIRDVKLKTKESESFQLVVASFTYKNRFYNISVIPNSKLVAIASVSTAEEAAVARNQLILFAVIGLLLAGIVTALVYWLSNSLSNPLAKLTTTADAAAAGNLDARAEVEGTRETRTLARTFNILVSEVQTLLSETKQVAQEQKESRDQLEMEIYQLLDEVGDATDGDLTVRASLSSMEMSTVADLFNAIIDNLNEIAGQVKTSSGQVSSSLDENGTEIQALAEQAVQETERTRTTLNSIEQMSMSIEDVANNAGKAALISDEAYTTVQEGSSAMDQTVDSILSLRNTVGETAKKIKRLGESSQKISQVVSLIDEIALKTNLLAINASVEASRAGEQGQGFTVVAEQVGALAEQSAAATKEIAQIVAGIQAETKEVTEAMEVGTNQVVDSTRLVETTKEKLAVVLTRSQEINDLMRSISNATVSQTETSKAVTTLMQQMAELARQRAESSTQVADSMQETAAVAQKLEAAVAQFKVEESS